MQVWWPPADRPVYVSALPEWDPDRGEYVDPDTGEPLPTWDQALDDLADDPNAQPLYVARFGVQVGVEGVLAGSPQAERCIGYLVKYLIKDLGDDLNPAADDHDGEGSTGVNTPARADTKAAAARRADHIARLVEVLRFEPCSPGCANWLRYGVQPKHPRPGTRPGCCRAKAHKPTHLGYGGRRVLVSRKWTAKDLADHRHDRRAHVLAVLGRTPDGERSATTDPPPGEAGPVAWEVAKNTDPDVPTLAHRILRNIAHAHRWRTEYHRARDGDPDPPATAPSPDQTEPAA